MGTAQVIGDAGEDISDEDSNCSGRDPDDGSAACQRTRHSQKLVVSQFAGQVMNLRGYDDAQRPTGETVRLRLMENGAARVQFDGLEPDWILWRVNASNQFCTTYAIPNSRNELIATDDEDCLDFRLDGRRIGLNFYGSTGSIDRYSGTLRQSR